MKCFKCGSVLDLQRERCTKCGTDISFYKKIVYTSNRYYNEGLMKAQGRDLTGAKDSLKMSLKIYKYNTAARNLLGLVEYGLGESAEGLKEWVLSKNLDPEDKISERFINYMNKNLKDLDSEGHGIKKYNQALAYCRSGSKDLAIIQLKKVISVHKNMTKAYILLALLYIDDGKYEHARNMLEKCLSVDRGNTTALHYLSELDKINPSSPERSLGVAGENERDQLIIPVRFRDYGSYLANTLYIILGALIGIAISWYVILPGRLEKNKIDSESIKLQYSEQISELQQKIAGLEAELKNKETGEPGTEAQSEPEESSAPSGSESEPETKASESEKESESAEETKVPESGPESSSEETKAPETGSPSSSESPVEESTAAKREPSYTLPVIKRLIHYKENNDRTVETVGYANGDDFAKFVDMFFTIDPTVLSDTNKDHYRNMAGMIVSQHHHNIGNAAAEKAVSEENWAEAARQYRGLSFAVPDNGIYRYNAAMYYEKAGDKENAANYYWQTVNIFPEMPEAEDAKQKYMALTGETDVPYLGAGIDPEAQRAPVTKESLIKEIP